MKGGGGPKKFGTIYKEKKQKPTTPGIPKRSPIQVLVGPDAAWLRCSDENRYIQRGMVVGDCNRFEWDLCFFKERIIIQWEGGI